MSDDLNILIDPELVGCTVSEYISFTTNEYVNQSLSAHNISLSTHQDIRALISELSGNDNSFITISAPIILDTNKQYAFRPTSANSIKNGIFEEVLTPNPLQIRDLITGILFNMSLENGTIVFRDASLLLYDGGISNTIYIDSPINGGIGDDIFDFIIDAGNS